MVKVQVKEKCQLGGCDHTPDVEFHDEGVCWKVTQKELEHQPTEKKFCPCKRQDGLIHRFKRTGFMEAKEFDNMVTKNCRKCGNLFLIRTDEAFCLKCRTKSIV